MVANAVRRIALGDLNCSGRFFADLDELTADGRQVSLSPPASRAPALAPAEPPPMPPTGAGDAPTGEEIRYVVACASSAPSGGNIQPWRFDAEANVIRAWIDPARSSLLDFRNRATLLALGAALEAAQIGARSLGFASRVRAKATAGPVWELALERSTRAHDEAALELLWQRCSNRRSGTSQPISQAELDQLARCGAPLDASVLAGDALAELGVALGALDRVRFLSHRLRRDLVGELRFTVEEAHGSRDGIDVASLELDGPDRAALEVLRTGAGMGLLADLDRGWGLGNASRDAFAGSAGAIVLRATAVDRAAVVAAGGGLMRLWLEATRRGLAVHPWGSPFLFQRLLEDADSLETWERAALTKAARAFGRVVGLDPDRPIMLILRLSRTDPPSTRSLRRPVEDVLTFAA
jgi:nitroreductase